jgi:hypothetical protein
MPHLRKPDIGKPHIGKTATAVLLAMYGIAGPAAAPAAASDLGLPERLDRTLRDLMQGVQPTLEDALDYMRSLGAIDDPLAYEMPEVLPNGDIIIRRRPDAPAPEAAPDGHAVPDAPPAADPPADPSTGPEEGVRI